VYGFFFSFVVKGHFAHKENVLKGFKSTLVEAIWEMLNDMSKYHSCSFKRSQFVLQFPLCLKPLWWSVFLSAQSLLHFDCISY